MRIGPCGYTSTRGPLWACFRSESAWRIRASDPVFSRKIFGSIPERLYSFIPEDRLKEIGIQPLLTRELILADGRHDRRFLGEAILTVPQLNESLTCPVIFAPQDSLYLFGATALENFAVQADPITQRLKPIAAVIGGFLASTSRPLST